MSPFPEMKPAQTYHIPAHSFALATTTTSSRSPRPFIRITRHIWRLHNSQRVASSAAPAFYPSCYIHLHDSPFLPDNIASSQTAERLHAAAGMLGKEMSERLHRTRRPISACEMPTLCKRGRLGGCRVGYQGGSREGQAGHEARTPIARRTRAHLSSSRNVHVPSLDLFIYFIIVPPVG